jgi:hypothetical protein
VVLVASNRGARGSVLTYIDGPVNKQLRVGRFCPLPVELAELDGVMRPRIKAGAGAADTEGRKHLDIMMKIASTHMGGCGGLERKCGAALAGCWAIRTCRSGRGRGCGNPGAASRANRLGHGCQ